MSTKGSLKSSIFSFWTAIGVKIRSKMTLLWGLNTFEHLKICARWENGKGCLLF